MGSSSRRVLAFVLTSAVALALLPVVVGAATKGDPLLLGEANLYLGRTNLRGKAVANLVIINDAAAGKGTALDLRVRSGSPPFKVNSDTRVDLLNADLLDGLDSSWFVPADQECTEEGSSVVGIDAGGGIVCLVGGATTTTTTGPGSCTIDDDCTTCMICTDGNCANAAIRTDPKSECGPYLCNGIGGCSSSCGADLDCAAGNFCDTLTNTCQAVFPNGDACTAPNQCESTFCTDDVCCETECHEVCRWCDSPPLGSCTFIPAGLDPDNECEGADVCDGLGNCVTPP